MDGQGDSTIEVSVGGVKTVQGGKAVGKRAPGPRGESHHYCWLRRLDEERDLSLQCRPVKDRLRKLKLINGNNLKTHRASSDSRKSLEIGLVLRLIFMRTPG